MIIMHTRKAYGNYRQEHMIMTCNILEQPSSWSTSRLRPSWPRSRLRLSLLLVSLSECIFCCHVPPSISLCIPTDRVSHLMLSLLSGWLLTNVQVNNITTLHDTHIYITSALLFFFLFTLIPLFLAGLLVQTLPVDIYFCYQFCRGRHVDMDETHFLS